MKSWKLGLLPVVCCMAGGAFAASLSLDPQTYLDDVKFLASPSMKGRATGSPELEKAAAFIAAR